MLTFENIAIVIFLIIAPIKNIAIVIFFIGAIIIARELKQCKCPKKKIDYKYLPRSLNVDLKNSSNVDRIFKSMFQESEPWMGTYRSDLNRFRKIKSKR